MVSLLVGTVLCFKLYESIQTCSLVIPPPLDKALIFFFSKLQRKCVKAASLRGMLVVKDPENTLNE